MEKDNKQCNYCLGDDALFYEDADNSAFIDSNGEIMVIAKGHIVRFGVCFCPKCGRKFN